MRISMSFVIGLFVCVALVHAAQDRIRLVGINDPITPVTAQFLHRNLEEAARMGERLVLIEMDTPGGLDTAMREIVKDVMASPVPVVVYVAPSGARAASAGAIIALAADVCAMAPGTNIGAAHPVSLGEKTTTRPWRPRLSTMPRPMPRGLPTSGAATRRWRGGWCATASP